MCSREELNVSLNTVVRDMTAKITEQEKARIAQDEENAKLHQELEVLVSYTSPRVLPSRFSEVGQCYLFHLFASRRLEWNRVAKVCVAVGRALENIHHEVETAKIDCSAFIVNGDGTCNEQRTNR